MLEKHVERLVNFFKEGGHELEPSIVTFTPETRVLQTEFSVLVKLPKDDASKQPDSVVKELEKRLLELQGKEKMILARRVEASTAVGSFGKLFPRKSGVGALAFKFSITLSEDEVKKHLTGLAESALLHNFKLQGLKPPEKPKATGSVSSTSNPKVK